ncbi:peptidoglycan editing factor PgeF [Pikeienuella piscinae]|uniref:Purine nucleoside phosphorylase n=1 Tax=Pikeienuella piscinae TaxID=2748098 RepID=A0A7L5BWC2_9RHOB|nr:peptidoglycan editing factor PgeF [Pikeienuella piscinae]QIE55443.1 peptidoglycan editing factor PgeF [Pikeienuella piscinae]
MTLAPIRTDAIKAPHGFFTRAGGVSAGIYAGLNCGPGSRDDPAAVAENRALVAAHLGARELLSLHQVHSPDVVVVAAPWAGERPKADAMATRTPGLALGVLTADCAPVLLEDPEAGVIGAAHAGWRGALAGVTDRTIEAMETLGAGRGRISAAIGPVISQRAYEVGPEFMDEFVAEDPETTRFFAGGAGDRVQFDLPGYLLARLRAAGIAEAAWTGHCTFSDEKRFYSYRRAMHRGEKDYGRLVSVVMLPGA